ncbi:MAG TPA: TIGR03435 family protein [Bryobacteraceae bacterium]|jgi:uncharacterized protein (TIGR03435 family)
MRAKLLFLAASAGLLLAQAPMFEVASVKSAIPGETGGRIQFLPGGRFVANNVALNFIIQQVYEVRDFQLVGAPNMMAMIADSYGARYEIQAKGDESATEAQVREMVKALLAERFQLKVHKETRDLPVYALIPAKSGIRIVASKDDGKPRGRGGIANMDRGWIQGTNVTMPALVQVLSRSMDRPVVDKTNFTEAFQFRLTWTPDGDAGSDGSCPASFAALQERLGAGTAPASCPSIYSAIQDQMGLKLDAQKDPIEVLVIDHVEKPSAN